MKRNLERDAMSSEDIFGRIPEDGKPRSPKESGPLGAPRVMRPDRQQMRFMPTDLESLLPEEHPARAIWAVVEKLDLSKFEAEIIAREGHSGRPGIDPRILVALWIYATSEGIGSAREVERLEEMHHAYQWICGGVHVNHHTLSDFRVEHRDALNDLFAQILGVLTHQGLVELKRVAQDGMRIRASAGAASFRREKSLKECLQEAQEQVKETAREAGSGEDVSARRKAAQERAARERQERVAKALEELPKAREAKAKKDEAKARVSTTDPEARVMKMADGGFRPAYNAQFATDAKTRVIVGVEVTNAGSDMAQMPPMLQNIKKQHGQVPPEYLVDGGFAKREAIEQASQQGVTVFAPVQKPKDETVDPHQPKPNDSPEVADWRVRMGTPEAKEIYKDRAATAETTNADLRCNRALDVLRVRGLPKVECVVIWAALTYNILKLIAVA